MGHYFLDLQYNIPYARVNWHRTCLFDEWVSWTWTEKTLFIYKHLYLIYLTHLILFPIILWLSLLSLILRVKPQNPAASREGPFLPVVIGRERDLANPELFFWTPITSLDIYTCEKARGGSITPVKKLSRTYIHIFFFIKEYL